MKTLVIIIVSSVVNNYTEHPVHVVKDTIHPVKEIKLVVKAEKDPALKEL